MPKSVCVHFWKSEQVKCKKPEANADSLKTKKTKDRRRHNMSSIRYRQFNYGITRAEVRCTDGGVQYVKADQALQPHPERMTDRLKHWAETTPDAVFLARRVKNADGSTGEWQRITYGQAWESARCIGQALLNLGLSAERPVAILSENSIEHALIALGGMVVGVPHCPVSTAYSLISQDFEKLRHIFRTITPGFVYAADSARYGKAIAATVAADIPVALSVNNGDALAGRAVTLYEQLLATPPTDAVDKAMAATGPDTLFKFLFTSGSTKLPKGVANTQRMWCANQQQMRQSMPVLTEEPPVLVDWLPWSHTFGGNHNLGLVIYNGGTMYIDDGKPVAALAGETLRNLREVAPTLYFNVPTGYEFLTAAMKTDLALRKNLLSRMKMFFYAGAALPQPVWDLLNEQQEAEIGERVVMVTSMGMTESAPFCLFVTSPDIKTGDLGLPAPGLELKLVPSNGKVEMRYKGPNIMPTYWRNPEATAEAFDEEGFFLTGDAVKWIDENDLHKGLRFDGRIAEDFKLSTGTFVSVGPLRGKIVGAGAPYIQDVVLTGVNMHEVGAMIVPTAALRTLSGLAASAPMSEVIASAPVQAKFQEVINQLAKTSTGSASRVARAIIMAEPPSIDKGEVTDKGSINQRAVLTHRAALVEALHNDSADHIIKPQ
jgi:feruloyl-CoA synthase